MKRFACAVFASFLPLVWCDHSTFHEISSKNPLYYFKEQQQHDIYPLRLGASAHKGKLDVASTLMELGM